MKNLLKGREKGYISSSNKTQNKDPNKNIPENSICNTNISKKNKTSENGTESSRIKKNFPSSESDSFQSNKKNPKSIIANTKITSKIETIKEVASNEQQCTHQSIKKETDVNVLKTTYNKSQSNSSTSQNNDPKSKIKTKTDHKNEMAKQSPAKETASNEQKCSIPKIEKETDSSRSKRSYPTSQATSSTSETAKIRKKYTKEEINCMFNEDKLESTTIDNEKGNDSKKETTSKSHTTLSHSKTSNEASSSKLLKQSTSKSNTDNNSPLREETKSKTKSSTHKTKEKHSKHRNKNSSHTYKNKDPVKRSCNLKGASDNSSKTKNKSTQKDVNASNSTNSPQKNDSSLHRSDKHISPKNCNVSSPKKNEKVEKNKVKSQIENTELQSTKANQDILNKNAIVCKRNEIEVTSTNSVEVCTKPPESNEVIASNMNQTDDVLIATILDETKTDIIQVRQTSSVECQTIFCTNKNVECQTIVGSKLTFTEMHSQVDESLSRNDLLLVNRLLDQSKDLQLIIVKTHLYKRFLANIDNIKISIDPMYIIGEKQLLFKTNIVYRELIMKFTVLLYDKFFALSVKARNAFITKFHICCDQILDRLNEPQLRDIEKCVEIFFVMAKEEVDNAQRIEHQRTMEQANGLCSSNNLHESTGFDLKHAQHIQKSSEQQELHLLQSNQLRPQIEQQHSEDVRRHTLRQQQVIQQASQQSVLNESSAPKSFLQSTTSELPVAIVQQKRPVHNIMQSLSQNETNQRDEQRNNMPPLSNHAQFLPTTYQNSNPATVVSSILQEQSHLAPKQLHNFYQPVANPLLSLNSLVLKQVELNQLMPPHQHLQPTQTTSISCNPQPHVQQPIQSNKPKQQARANKVMHRRQSVQCASQRYPQHYPFDSSLTLVQKNQNAKEVLPQKQTQSKQQNYTMHQRKPVQMPTTHDSIPFSLEQHFDLQNIQQQQPQMKEQQIVFPAPFVQNASHLLESHQWHDAELAQPNFRDIRQARPVLQTIRQPCYVDTNFTNAQNSYRSFQNPEQISNNQLFNNPTSAQTPLIHVKSNIINNPTTSQSRTPIGKRSFYYFFLTISFILFPKIHSCYHDKLTQ